ncbi:MAG: hypothetical protein U9O56_05270 [Campylobacterota bacterium]|nr:hypothetical protein [Campylobacterota bacterium]
MLKKMLKISLVGSLLSTMLYADLKYTKYDSSSFKRDNNLQLGVYHFDNNSEIYLGEIKSDKYAGMGVKILDDGTIKMNQYANDKKINGMSFEVSGDRDFMYFGDYKNGQREGHGIMYWAKSGDIYIGEFKNGYRDGMGTYRFPSGKIQKGLYKKNKFQGSSSSTSSTNTTVKKPVAPTPKYNFLGIDDLEAFPSDYVGQSVYLKCKRSTPEEDEKAGGYKIMANCANADGNYGFGSNNPFKIKIRTANKSQARSIAKSKRQVKWFLGTVKKNREEFALTKYIFDIKDVQFK